MKKKRYILKGILSTLFYVSIGVVLLSLCYYSLLGFTQAHEAVHVEVYRAYGIGSEVEINYKTLEGKTIAVSGDLENCNENCVMMHMYNEIVGYNVQALHGSIWVIFFLWILVYLLIKTSFEK